MTLAKAVSSEKHVISFIFFLYRSNKSVMLVDGLRFTYRLGIPFELFHYFAPLHTDIKANPVPLN